MRFRELAMQVGISVSLAVACLVPLGTAAADAPALFLREVKITGDEFVVLQAAQDVTLSDYWLGYSSNDAAANVVPTQQLPAQPLKAGQALLLTSDGSSTCDAVLISKLSFSLSDSKGVLSLRRLQNSGTTSMFSTVDSVNWAKPSASGTTADNIDLRKETGGMALPVWYHTPAASTWQVGDFAACTLTFAADGTAVATSVTWPQNDTDPPAIIESLADDGSVARPYLPAADVGLLPPQITELLPNPTGTGTDGTDEFIELYNPNGAPFNLSGFTLQTGLTTKHNYTFPDGTSLPPKNFVAFYSADTGLTLSNTSGQADLEDPFGTVISESDAYGSAKGGQSWALAKGTWYWTGKPTPSATNVINQTSGPKITTTSAKKAAAAVKGASTTKNPLQTGSTNDASTIAPAPVHPYVLVAVAVLAVGYGVYEYRHDLANHLNQFRSDRAARRKARG